MTKREPKGKIQIPTRTARPKGDMYKNLRRPDQVETVSIEELVAPPDSTQLDSTQLNSTHVNSTQSEATLPEAAQLKPIAPAKDFNRRANSLDRDALPAGLFPGTSKKLYDALYLRTRGAVVPTRSIQATRTDLMRWAGIGGLNTFLAHMKHFQRIGLIVRQFEVGNRGGALYEVRLPEEIDLSRLNSTQLDSTQLNSTQNRGLDSTQKLSRVESSNPVENTGTYAIPKTSFKTNTESDDDEAFAEFNAALKKAAKEITGREPSQAEAARWGELAEVLVTELKIAAGRTTVSSVPAFLAEHLRRRLWKKEKRQIEAERSKEQSDSAPKGDASQCPDCFGTGMWYPEGFEKGVARCEHKSLGKQDA